MAETEPQLTTVTDLHFPPEEGSSLDDKLTRARDIPSVSDDLLYGRVALVTGSATPDSIGEAIVLDLANYPMAGIVVNGRGHPNEDGTPQPGELLVQRINGLGRLKAIFIAADVTSTEEVSRMMEEIGDTFDGRLNILVNNAGRNDDKQIRFVSDEDARVAMELNAYGALRTMRAAYHLKIEREGESGTYQLLQKRDPVTREPQPANVVYVSTAGVHSRLPTQGTYSASKSAGEAFTRQFVTDHGRKNITGGIIRPGFVETGLTRHYDQARRDSLNQALGSSGDLTPQDVARGVVFLATRHDPGKLHTMTLVK